MYKKERSRTEKSEEGIWRYFLKRTAIESNEQNIKTK